MSSRPLAVFLAAALGVLLSGCGYFGPRGSGVAKTETRPVEAFERISVAGSPDVVARVGSEPSLVVTGDDNLLAYLVTRVENGTLHVSLKRSGRVRVPMRIEVTTPRLEEVRIAGSADVEATGIAGTEFRAAIAGSGDLKATGKVDRLEVRIAGSGDMHLFDLAARSVDVRIAGSGDADVRASEELSVRIAGSGDVRYDGDPKIERSVAGSGEITRR
jgi:hypothetical protein